MESDRAQRPPAGPAVAVSEPVTDEFDVGAMGTVVLAPVPAGSRGFGASGTDRAVNGRLDGLGVPRLPAGPGGPKGTGSAPRTRSRRGRVHRRRRLAVAYAVAVGLLAAGAAVAFGARAQLRGTDTQVAAVQGRLQGTLERARRAQADLTLVTAQSTAAAGTLATETSQLAAVETQLASTEANVYANGISIDNLDACLAGVEQALNQISLGDQHGAAVSLDGVAASCRAASPSP